MKRPHRSSRPIEVILPLLIAAASLGAAGISSAAPGNASNAGVEVAASTAPAEAPPLQLVESVPIETSLDHAGIPDAYQVWPEMIGSAVKTLDFAEFYASGEPGSRLDAIVAAVESAAKRGVRIRYLAEEKFYRTYPEILDRFAKEPGIEVRRFNVASLMGGVLHAKYFIVDGGEGYLGSQNFDWRSLTHIQELGVRIREPHSVRALADVFEMDWALAGGAKPGQTPPPSARAGGFPVRLATGADTTDVTFVASPRGWLPDSSLWDLPRIVGLIDGAKKSVRIQLLTYKTTERNGGFFEDLESALRRAAARGVDVQLLLADWCMRPGTIEGLKSLEPLQHVEVKLVTIPPWSGGFVPFARVIHAKYLVVDGRDVWVGTGNWERDYFYASRNVGLVIRGGSIPPTLDRFFLDGWNGPYAEEVDPCRAYEAPRTSE